MTIFYLFHVSFDSSLSLILFNFLEEFWGPKRKAGRLMKEPAEGQSVVKTKSKRGGKKNGRTKGHQNDGDGDGDNGDDNGGGESSSSSSSSSAPSLPLSGTAIGTGSGTGTGVEMDLDSSLEAVIGTGNNRSLGVTSSRAGDAPHTHSLSAEGDEGPSSPSSKKPRSITLSEF